jgi:hypothetical protein
MTDRWIVTEQPATYRDDAALVVRLSERIRRKHELLGLLRKQLRFPGYFGGNWDALHDCLRDLSWLKEVPRVVLLHESWPFAADSRQRAIWIELLQSLTQDPPPGTPVVLVVAPPLPTRSDETH